MKVDKNTRKMLSCENFTFSLKNSLKIRKNNFIYNSRNSNSLLDFTIEIPVYKSTTVEIQIAS